MTIQERTKDLIIQLKKVKEREGFSNSDILRMVEANGDNVSMSTIVRVMADGSENNPGFRYHDTIKPIAKVLLGLDRQHLEGLSDEERATKDIVLLKEMEIKEKNIQIEHLTERVKELTAKIEAQEMDSRRRIDYLKDQIAIKDKQIAEKDASIKKRDDMLQNLSNGLIEVIAQTKKE